MNARASRVVEAAPVVAPAPAMPELIPGPLVYVEGDPMADCLRSVRAAEHHYAAHATRLGELTLRERREQAQSLIAGGPW